MTKPDREFFGSDHLPPELAAVSRQFENLADALEGDIEPHPELDVALRKLLEAKDAAVRAKLAESS